EPIRPDGSAATTGESTATAVRRRYVAGAAAAVKVKLSTFRGTEKGHRRGALSHAPLTQCLKPNAMWNALVLRCLLGGAGCSGAHRGAGGATVQNQVQLIAAPRRVPQRVAVE